MKRTDRLMAILIALQQGPETAQSLADKLEVSKRTVLRDMQSLSEMGIPLYSMTGPSGGFRLMDGFRLPPLQLDAQEALTVLFALRAMTKIADTPFNRARWTVMDKIKAALPEQTLKQIEPLLKHAEVEVPVRKVKAPHLPALLEHTADSKWLHVLYRSEKHRRWLQIHPRRIYTAHGFWYCEAYSVQHQEERTFRVDRFEKVEVMSSIDGETLPTSGQSGDKAASDRPSGGHTEAMSTRDPGRLNMPDPKRREDEPPIRIAAKLTYRGALIAEQDPDIGECVKQISDEQWELEFTCPSSEWKWAVRFFYSLGMDAEVTAPEALREEIRELASQLYGRYGPKE